MPIALFVKRARQIVSEANGAARKRLRQHRNSALTGETRGYQAFYDEELVTRIAVAMEEQVREHIVLMPEGRK